MMMSERFPVVSTLVINDVIADSTRDGPTEDTPALDRVCWVNRYAGKMGLIDLTDEKAYPRIESIDVIECGFAEGTLSVVQDCTDWSPAPAIQVKNESKDIKAKREKDYQRAKNRYKLIKNLVTNHEEALFDPKERGALIRELVDKKVASWPCLSKLIRLWYRNAMVIEALCTNHPKCGAPGVERVPSEKKRGRPPKPENRTPDKPGINITTHIASLLKQGYIKFKIGKKYSYAKAYRRTMGRFFAKGYRFELGMEGVPILPQEDELPTLIQFRYWGEKKRNRRKDKIHGRSAKQFNLENRESLGCAREDVHGPGDRYQIDATGGLIHLVARKNRKKRIGKAVIYAVCDTWSQYVVGWVVVLEHASFGAMMVALERAFTDKIAYCKSKGIDIDAEDWPGDIICDAILGDRGSEVMGHQSDNVVHALGTDFDNTPPGRAEWKSYIERIFGHFKQALADVDGASKGPKQRGEENPADHACLNLDELEELVIRNLMLFNHTHEVKDHPDAIFLESQGIPVTPVNLWKWGMENRSGAGRRFDEEHVRAALLHKQEVPATREGLEFQKLCYFSKTLSGQGEFTRVKGRTRQRFVIAYDPRCLSEIWLMNDEGKLIEKCPLTSKYQHNAGISLWELERLRADAVPTKVDAKTRQMELEYAETTMRQDLIDKAKAQQDQLPDEKMEFDQQSREAEQNARRHETAWTGDEAAQGQDWNSQDYVSPANYRADKSPPA